MKDARRYSVQQLVHTAEKPSDEFVRREERHCSVKFQGRMSNGPPIHQETGTATDTQRKIRTSLVKRLKISIFGLNERKYCNCKNKDRRWVKYYLIREPPEACELWGSFPLYVRDDAVSDNHQRRF